MKKRVAYVVTGIVLALTLFFCFSGTVYSQSKRALVQRDRERLASLEREYRQAVQEVLSQFGCSCGGITMTKTFSPKEGLQYRVALHHRNFSYLGDAQRESLLKALEALSGELGDGFDASFTYCFSS